MSPVVCLKRVFTARVATFHALCSPKSLAELLSEAASLVLNSGSNEVCFRPENLCCALGGEHTAQLLREVF
jgi:hypothetical protein